MIILHPFLVSLHANNSVWTSEEKFLGIKLLGRSVSETEYPRSFSENMSENFLGNFS
jgi:hypothetical protein